MAARYLLDTNICIYALSSRYPAVTKRMDRLAPGEARLSVIVLGELLYGVAKSAKGADARLRLQALQQIVPVQPLPDDIAGHYGDIRAGLERMGTPIGNNDLWIAAHARAAGLTLVTNNEREFGRVAGLKLANWAKI
jgi:tRNA(fMet)-specific endonuclease VapC